MVIALSDLAFRPVVKAFNEDEERDDTGKWTSSADAGEVARTPAHSPAHSSTPASASDIGDALSKMTIPDSPHDFGFDQDVAARITAPNREALSATGPDGAAIVSIVKRWTGWNHESKEEIGDITPLVKAADTAPSSTVPLYRAISFGREFSPSPLRGVFESLKVGDVIPINGTASFTSEKSIASQHMSSGDVLSDVKGVLMTLAPGAPALNIAPISNAPEENEHVVSGALRVTSVGRWDRDVLLGVERV
jgi:hypothetical protein